jgi:hypothetical protein
MVVDLRKIPIMYMTCDKSLNDRQKSFERMMYDLGLDYEKMNGKITDNYNIGVAEEYIKALSKYEPPFLILEDDARIASPAEDFEYVYSIPKYTDALYLGTSIVGRIQNQTKIGVIAANDGDYLRIFNMLSFHAVLYLSKNYVHECVKTLNEYISYPNGACDDLLAERMWKYNIAAVKNPVFYQQDGRNEQMTLTTIKPVLG